MKRHENLYSAIVAFVSGVLFLVFGIVVFVILQPFIEDAAAGMKVFNLIPMTLFAIAAILVIIGVYSLINDYLIEHGKAIEATVTGISEFFTGEGTEDVSYNLFCEAVVNGRKYRFSKKKLDLKANPLKVGDSVPVKINPKNPMQYYIML